MAKQKKGFMDVYETYDVEKEGYGNPDQWRSAFKKRMSLDEAEAHLKDESPYTILGMTQASTWEEVKKAYRQLALKFHPDKNPGNEKESTTMMQKIIAAYTILKKKFKK